MKIWSVFSLVIVFHFVIIGLLFIQPGCQSKPADSPDPSITAPSSPNNYTPSQPVPQLDSAFNAGVPTAVSPTPASAGRRLSAPTRPDGTTPSTPTRVPSDSGILQPVRDPVADSFSLPSATREYTVKKGDTLSGIARSQGVALVELLAANSLNKASTIYVGQTLFVPQASSSSASPSPASQPESVSSREVVVARGDTLSGIAARHRTTVKVIQSLNQLRGETIYVGQQLLVPDTGTFTSPDTVVSPPPSRPLASGDAATYVVKAGDTPSGIARRFGISSRELMAANAITDPTKLYVGRELVVPSGGTANTFRPAPTRPPEPEQASPLRSPSRPATTPGTASPQEEAEQDPMAALEALEDEDLPFVEVEAIEEDPQP